MANTLRFKRGLVSGIPTAALGEPLFTTDTFDLYIGNGTGNTRFQKYIASGATTQILRGDGSLYTFPLNISSPTTGQVLKYNGTSWVNDSDAGITGSGSAGQVAYFTGATTQGGSNNLFWDAANNRLGINTNAPSYTADIRSAAGTVLSLSGGSSTNQGAALYITNSAFTGTLTAFGDSANILGGTPDASATIFTGSSIPLHFYINGGQAARISTSRNFIINNASTDNGLRFQVTGSGYFSVDINLPNSGEHYIQNLASTTFIGLNFDTPYIRFGVNNTERMRLDYAGNLGLGVVPSAWGSSLSAIDIGQNSRISGSLSMAIGNNAFFNGTSWIYKNTGTSALNVMPNAGGHQWFIAPSGTAGNAITFTQAMTLDASGRLGIGVTSPTQDLQIGGTGNILVAAGGTFFSSGQLYIRSGASQPLDFGANNINSLMRLDTAGRLLIGTTISSTFLLDVNGTMRVSGASTFGGIMQIGSGVIYSGMPAYAQFIVGSRTTTDAGIVIQSTSTSISRLLLLNASDNGSIVRQDHSTGEFEIFNNGSRRFSIASTGAATFSSSVTAANGVFNGVATYNLKVQNGASANTLVEIHSFGAEASGESANLRFKSAATSLNEYAKGLISFVNNGTGYGRGDLVFAINNDAISTNVATSDQRMRITSDGNVGIAMTPSYKLDVTGEARVSNAIAIGTTPDTNKPFKILKNINGTVGINFENTSTGSLAFSAIQMGTDVAGGTKFTNIVYSSSGVAQSGVYYPDGTSIINIGTGGLNFYSQGAPIRMFNGGGNGVLKWEMVNDSFINHYTGTAPTTSATDGYRQYSADVTAGNAAPHFRTENGAVIKLYQETTGVGNAIFSQGGGNSVLDDSTFDGYTLRQIVKALRNQGILA